VAFERGILVVGDWLDDVASETKTGSITVFD